MKKYFICAKLADMKKIFFSGDLNLAPAMDIEYTIKRIIKSCWWLWFDLVWVWVGFGVHGTLFKGWFS